MVGLMGGTFNPVHYGHLLMCESIREEFNLNKIIFIPARIPPHKTKENIISPEDRLRMVELAIEDNPYFKLSDIEIRRSGPSYTVDTLKEFRKIYSFKELFLIVGADSLVQFHTWRDYQQIFSLSKIIVAKRPDTDENLLNEHIDKFTNEMGAKILVSGHRAMDYSSTEIRERIKKGASIRYRTPASVADYIYKRGLYRSDKD
ncbi:MAG: nicotinate-nucleotide adenylyltransferase [Clostridiaceae bacterium]|nr:nicotinate-nucleotide adenylyltransferase [Clostridiaceae bacterium]